MRGFRELYGAFPRGIKEALGRLRREVIYRIPADKWVQREWRQRFGEELDLKNPRTYNELWL